MKSVAAVMVALPLLISAVANADTKEVLTVAGVERSYELHIPPQLPPRPALVIALHPRPANGSAMRYISGFNAVSDTHGFLVAYPNGQDKQWNGLTCCGDADDVRLIKAIAEKAQSQHGADPNRTYLVGVSNGGELAYRAAGELPDTLAAIAVVAGGRVGVGMATGQPVRSIVPSAAVSLITMIGAKDGAFTDQLEGLDEWRKQNSCPFVQIAHPFPAMRIETARCRNSSDVVAYVFDEVGHVWPGAANIGPMSWPDAPFNTAETIWRFFSEHPRQE